MRMRQVLAAGALMAALPLAAAQAAVIDNMDNTNYFGTPFGAAFLVDNADGTVTLAKSSGASVDSGVEWNDLGAKIALSDNLVTITPAVPGEDYINVNAIYFNGSDAFVNQALVVSDTNQETPIVFDVAPSAGAGAVSYVLQIRVLPFEAESAAYTFDSIAAVPEPASLALLASAGLFFLARKRSH